tara:strand:- start:705 stop:1127 length:423 start_codon:yes stop_codon:yes gene_type:complete
MWYLSLLPNAFFHAIVVAGVVAVLGSMFLKMIPFVSKYYIPMRIIGFVVFTFGIYFEGGLANEEQWVAKVKEMEVKVAAAEAEGKKETIKIQQKVVVQQQVIREKGEDIVRYIDREIVKYDNSCIIPKEVIDTHNKAAKK